MIKCGLWLLIRGIILIVTIGMVGCSSGKFVADFKVKKKSIDTLSLVQPLVYVQAYTGQSKSVDYELGDLLRKQLAAQTLSMLNEKYVVQSTIDSIADDAIPWQELQILFYKLDYDEGKYLDIRMPSTVEILTQMVQGYGLLLVFDGYYDASYEPNENMVESMKTNMVYIGSRNLFAYNIRVILFDRVSKQILYHNKLASGTDPRLPAFVEQSMLEVLRTIYYK